MRGARTVLCLILGICGQVMAAPGKPRCLQLKDHFARDPIALRGKLAVTYVEQGIDPKRGDQHELATFELGRPGRGFRRLTHNLVNEAEPEISPDGKSMLYTVRPKLDGFEQNSEIWRVGMNGGGSRKLAGGRPLGVPAWLHPRGEGFTFIEWGTESGDSRLLLQRGGVAVAFPGAPLGVADPEVSYDGKLITFKRAVEGDREFQPSIWVMNADGTGQRRLTRNYSDHDPVFSKDGRKIYFERYYGPGDWFEASKDRSVPEHNWWGIVEVDVRTRKEKIIVPHDPCGRHFFWLPTVSPDGKALMYTHIDVWGKVWTDLWVSRIDGKAPQKVRGSDWFYFFDWSK